MPDPGDPHLTYRYEDPFAAPEAERRLDRRLRGRLVAPVTVWTAGDAGSRTGLTVSSLIVVEGEPAQIVGAIDPLSELRDMIESSRRFTVHVLGDDDRRLAGMFAGTVPLRPFEGLDVEDTDHGPRLAGERTVVACSYEGAERVGHLDLVRAGIDRVDLGADPARPAAFYRGRFRRLAADGLPET